MRRRQPNWKPSSPNTPRSAEFLNPSNSAVTVIGPNGEQVVVPPKAKIILPEFFVKFSPRHIRFLRFIQTNTPIRRQVVKPPPIQTSTNRPITEKINRQIKQNRSKARQSQGMKAGSTNGRKHQRGNRVGRPNVWRSRTVGKSFSAGSQNKFIQVVSESQVPISNNIGVGILSFNRFGSLRRLIESIKANTDLNRTTVFVSDESNNFTADQVTWLAKQDIVLLRNQRIGVAGNTNRLLQCLSRFKYKIVLNDDVEIINPGWAEFLVSAMKTSGLHHFCYRQPGIYGASEDDEKTKIIKGVKIRTITTKPHGSVLTFDDEAFKAVGFFDERFGMYGMEHVDWSERVAAHFNQPGFHDPVGSENYFVIHNETSAVPQRVNELRLAREYYEKVKGTRKYVNRTDKSSVPSMSVVIPYRNTGRNHSMRTVIANMKAQRFPNLEIIVVEQDDVQHVDVESIAPAKYIMVPNQAPNKAFCKSRAFNRGVLSSEYELIILHDADIIAPGSYLAEMHKAMQTHTGVHMGEHVYYLSANSTTTINNTAILSPQYECVRVVQYFEGGSLGIHKKTYIDIGGFNEEFVGYGVEDCCFYARLAECSRFANDRKFKFFHLHHGRTPGWDEFHDVNRNYYGKMLKTYPNQRSYSDMLRERLKITYKL